MKKAKAPKILFVGVFDSSNRSTNNSQIIAFNEIGCQVSGYNYRLKGVQMGNPARDTHLEQTVRDGDFDLVVYSKCNVVSYKTFKYINSLTTTCLWFMDPLVSYDEELQTKTQLVDFACFDKENVLSVAQQFNKNSFYVCEGFDSFVDKPYPEAQKQHDVSFIGNIYGQRQELLNSIDSQITIINNVYGFEHAKAVAASKINLNFCTSGGASDRIYKILGSQGFLISDDWVGREAHFEDGKDLVIYKNIKDLGEKIKHYLSHDKEREEIALQGYNTVQKFNRLNWAKRIVEIYEKKNEGK